MKKILAWLLILTAMCSLFTGCAQQVPTSAGGLETTPSAAGLSSNPQFESAAKLETSAVDLTILKEQDDSMINTYTLLAVNPDAPFTDTNGHAVSGVAVNTAGAAALIRWILSDEGREAASGYGKTEYGDTLFYLKDDAPRYTGQITPATNETKTIRLSTTTSVNDSGLLGYLLPVFESKYGYTVEVQSVGTGKAIASAKYGNADLILVHAKSQEEDFVEDGFSYILDGFESERLSFLYNYFVLCGPSSDPAGVASKQSVPDAFAAIAEGEYPFISRGDNSGTHTKELSLWPESLGIASDAATFAGYTSWYISANAGMGTCLVMAEEMGAYILTDKATFLTFTANGGRIG